MRIGLVRERTRVHFYWMLHLGRDAVPAPRHGGLVCDNDRLVVAALMAEPQRVGAYS